MPLRKYAPFDDFLSNYFKDDFSGLSVAGRAWETVNSSGGSYTYPSNNEGGTVVLTANANNYIWFKHNEITGALTLARKPFVLWRGKLDSLTSIRGGWGAINSTTDEIEWFYDASLGANWRIKTRAANTDSITDTGIAADTNFHEFKIEADSAVVVFSLDGSPIGRITTNLPTVTLAPCMRVTSQTGATRAIISDVIEFYHDRI
jgi:hypothetical protein